MEEGDWEPGTRDDVQGDSEIRQAIVINRRALLDSSCCWLTSSHLRSVALLEFFSRTAGARIVAAHFFLGADDLLYWLRFAASRHPRLFQFATLAAHKGFFQIVGGG